MGGVKWCPRDPKVSAVPRGSDRIIEGQAGMARRRREGHYKAGASEGLACEDDGSRQAYDRMNVRVSRGKVRLCNRSGVTRKGGSAAAAERKAAYAVKG